jgi:NhaA family Na+:H+ antiporter
MPASPPKPAKDPPGSSPSARAIARRALAPIERFLAVEASSGALLILASVFALACANSRFAHSYEALWHTAVGLRVGRWEFTRDLHFWINDGAMSVFFFVVGLEIRREIHEGELSDLRRAALPLAAALGGMLVPAAIYAAVNRGLPSARGWGVPMATDIAFAVGVLALLGKRVPPAARVLLLALAVIDDVGGILVLAVFYSAGFAPGGLVLALLGAALVLALQALGVRRPWAYLPPSVVLWIGALRAGVHPTLAGVVVGLLTPVTAWLGRDGFEQRVRAEMGALHALARHEVLDRLDAIEHARREAVSPVDRLQHAFHRVVAYGIMPLFALANAGVTLSAASLSPTQRPVVVGITLALCVGKPVGISLASLVAVRLGLAALPRGMRWSHVMLVALLGGIGFTMSLFIATLAFGAGPSLDAAKTAVLVASTTTGVIALGVGRVCWPATVAPDAAQTEAEAEQSTER